MTRHVLSNGARVLIREDHSLPTMSVKVLFKGGLLSETKSDNGISNLFSEMLLLGTKKRSAQSIVEGLEKAGGHISNYSGNNSFGFSIDVLAKHWSLAVELLSDIVMEPTLPAQELAKEKQAVLLDIQSLEDQIFQTASKLFRQTMFEGHPYQFITQGTKESVTRLRREDLLSYYQRYVVGPNTVITLGGDVEAKKVVKALEKALAKMPNHPASFPAFPRPAAKKPKSVSKTQDGKQAVILLGYPGVNMTDPDRYVFEVMDALFSGQGARLFDAIRETHGLAYLVGCYQITGVEPGAFVFYVGTVPDKVDFVVDALRKEIHKIKSTGVDPEELERAKRGLIGARKSQLQTNAQIGLQTGLDELYGLGWDDYKKYYQRVQTVTVEDIRRVANRYFDDDRQVLSIVQPPKQREAAKALRGPSAALETTGR